MALDIITSVSGVFRRDYAVPAAELPSQASGFLNPNASDALDQGEWLIPNANGQYIRPVQLDGTAFASASAGDEANSSDTDGNRLLLARCVFSVKGDYPAQALGKVTLIQSIDWEGSTDMYNGTPSIGDKLGLSKNSDGQVVLDVVTASNDLVVAMCTQGVSGGRIRFQAIQPYFI